MYSDEEKDKLMKELKEMESLKVDTGSEGKVLQKDLIDYMVNGNGDKEDLIFRIELFTYAFKLFSRKEVKLDKNQFVLPPPERFQSSSRRVSMVIIVSFILTAMS